MQTVPMAAGSGCSAGEGIAVVLAGAWRPSPSPLRISAEQLSEVAPSLLRTGGGGLAWWRVKHSRWPTSPELLRFRQAYRLQHLLAALHERWIQRAVARLRSSGIEPLLGKGWAVARLYPDRGLRPCGDIDLYVRREQYMAAAGVLAGCEDEKEPTDLHPGLAELDDRSADEVYRRSQLLALDDVAVRAFGPEDHLRLVALHMLRHGAFRPLWLCDVAVALESRPPDFDWDYFRSGNQRRSHWVACALGLAHRLLEARLDGVPLAARVDDQPRWLVPAVLRQWGAAQTPQGARVAMAAYLRHPSGVLEALRARWPNAIEATVGVGGPFNEWPRLPFQVADSLLRSARFALELPRRLVEGGRHQDVPQREPIATEGAAPAPSAPSSSAPPSGGS